MSAARERLIRKLSRMQAFGEKALFFVEPVRPPPAMASGMQAVDEEDPAPLAGSGSGPARAAPAAGAVSPRTKTAPVRAPAPEPLAGARSGVGGRSPAQAPAASEAGTGVTDQGRGRSDPGLDEDEVGVERRWRELEKQVAGCRLCRLCENRRQAVFGSGTRRTRLFVIGEGPGEQEDRQGEAFVGPAGQLLTKILKAIGFERDQVFITNIVKCRPPRNRAPLPDEVAACAPFLEAQLEMVRPVAILALGASATQALLGYNAPLSRVRGRVHLYRGIPLVPTYHPAALLRNPAYKRPTWEDVQVLRRVYDDGLAALEAGA